MKDVIVPGTRYKLNMQMTGEVENIVPITVQRVVLNVDGDIACVIDTLGTIFNWSNILWMHPID